MFGQVEKDPALPQALIKLYQAFGGSHIDISDPAGIHYDLVGVFPDSTFNLITEQVDIGKEEIAAEAVDHSVFDGTGSGVAL